MPHSAFSNASCIPLNSRKLAKPGMTMRSPGGRSTRAPLPITLLTSVRYPASFTRGRAASNRAC